MAMRNDAPGVMELADGRSDGRTWDVSEDAMEEVGYRDPTASNIYRYFAAS